MTKLWKEGNVLSIKLRDNLFTLAQVAVSPCLMFFDIANKDGVWQNVNLNNVDLLFCVAVATARVKPLIVEQVDAARVVPTSLPMPKLVIKPHLNLAGGHAFRGGDLVEMDDRGETTGRPIIKKNLSVEADTETIRQYELTNMWVVPEKLRDRLTRYFDTGVNWDPHKELVFPGITAPPPQGKGVDAT